MTKTQTDGSQCSTLLGASQRDGICRRRNVEPGAMGHPAQLGELCCDATTHDTLRRGPSHVHRHERRSGSASSHLGTNLLLFPDGALPVLVRSTGCCHRFRQEKVSHPVEEQHAYHLRAIALAGLVRGIEDVCICV